MKKISAILLISVLLLTLLFTTGCYTGYKGEYPELCSAAWVNLPMASGASFNGEVIYDPGVIVLETDGEGRTLFYYNEDGSPYWNILITQKSKDGKVYFYSDDCYLSHPWLEEYFFESDVKNMVYECISEEELLAFKALNDWGQPINDAKCESTEIITKKSEGKHNPGEAKLEEYAKEYYERVGRYIHPKNGNLARISSYITCDGYGRELYIIESWVEDFSEKYETMTYYNLLMVIMPDGSCDTSNIIMVENPYECRDEIKAIKDSNNWNKPLN